MHQKSNPIQSEWHQSFEDVPQYDQLPREIPRHFRLSQLFVIFLGMLLSVVIANILVIGFLGQYTTNFGYFLSYQKWQLLKDMDEPVQWLVLGDSSVNQGINPTIIEEELGGGAVNLGTNGDMIALNDLWMLEYYIKKFGPPENVIIGHVYDVWHRDFNPVLLGQIPLPWNFWNSFSATENLIWNRKIQRDTFLERYVPIYSQNNTLGRIIQDTFQQLRNPFQSDWHLDSKGYLPTFEPRPELVVTDANDHIQFATENKFEFSDLNKQAMTQILRLAEEHEINVYVVLGPQYEGFNADQNVRDYLSSLSEQLSSFASQSDTIHFIPEIKTFPANQMQNADHLINTGAQEYTRWLVERITEIQ